MKFVVELPPDSQLDFRKPTGPRTRAGSNAGGTPLVVRDERDGTKQVLWAPGDAD